MFGELLAVIAAMAAVLVEWADWGNGTWLVIVATITGTLALLWYAFMQVSEGEPPLTAPLAERMRLVAHATEMELQGIVFDWDGIDRQGRIPMDMTNWSKLTPEGQETYRRNGMDRALLSPEMVASSELARQKAVLQVLDVVESPDAPLPRTVLRIVEGRGTDS